MRFVRASTPLVGFVGGRGSGKTFAGAYRVLRHAAPTRTYLVVAPTYTMLRDVAFRVVVELASQIRALRNIRLSRLAIDLYNGATIIFRSADQPDRLRGLSVAGAWLDEASLMPKTVWDVVLFTLREESRAWLAATSTPRGINHWTYSVFGHQRDGMTLVHAPTWSNPFLPADFIDLVAKEASGRLAEQELEGRFVSLEGAEWPADFWGDWVMVPPEAMPPIAEYECRVIAVDPSLGRREKEGDYSAIVALGIARGLLWVIADIARRPPWQIVEDTLRLCDQWRPHAVGIEATAFQELLVHEFERRTVGCAGIRWPTFAIDNRVPKVLRIRRLGQYITRRELRIQDDPGGRLLLGQLIEFPNGQHDDGPDALEMAVRLVLELAGGTYHDATVGHSTC